MNDYSDFKLPLVRKLSTIVYALMVGAKNRLSRGKVACARGLNGDALRRAATN